MSSSGICVYVCVDDLMWHLLVVSSGGAGGTAGHGDDGRAGQGVQSWAQLRTGQSESQTVAVH